MRRLFISRISAISGVVLAIALTAVACYIAPSQAATASAPRPGVPSSYLGTLRLSENGRALDHNWLIDSGHGGDCPSRSNHANVYVTRQGWADLHTSGAVGSCAQLSSGRTWTAGVFEAKVWFSGGPNGIADFPAYWMSGDPWPKMGEIDAAEAGWDAWWRCLSATWHYNAYGPHGRYSPASSGPTCISAEAPHWYLVDIVRKPGGRVEVWYNGRLRWSWNTRYPIEPEYDIVDITSAYPGRPADILVSWVRIWNYR